MCVHARDTIDYVIRTYGWGGANEQWPAARGDRLLSFYRCLLGKEAFLANAPCFVLEECRIESVHGV